MKNPIAKCLFALGILIILVAIITGINVVNNYPYGFDIKAALSWWASGIIGGLFFIGIGEIINLLQKLLDQRSSSDQIRSLNNGHEDRVSTLANINEPSDFLVNDDSELKIVDLTIILNEERFKGQFIITPEELRIYKKSFLEHDSDARLITAINKKMISPGYEKNKDYMIFTYNDGVSSTIAFKTHNIFDYDKVIEALTINQED